MANALRRAPGILKNSDGLTPKPEPEDDLIIIQCPSCHAKFSLSASTLAEVENPRFHCSRCDHLFSREENFPASPSAPYESPAETAAGESFSYDDEDLLGSFAAPEDDKSLQQPDSRWTTGWDFSKSSTRAFEIPEAIESSRLMGPPHESTEDSSGNDDLRKQMSFDFTAASREIIPPSRFDFNGNRPEIEEERDYREAVEQATAVTPVTVPPKPASPWHGALFIMAPILGFLVLLLAAALYLRSNPGAASSIFSGYFPDAPQVAPAGLMIRDLKFKQLALENGERIALISGTVENHSQTSFREIMLEGLAFDASGKKIVSRKVNAASTLAKTRVKSFSSDMIEELQNRPPAKRFLLEPGQQQEFALALTDPRMKESRYFSARIHSVK